MDILELRPTSEFHVEAFVNGRSLSDLVDEATMEPDFVGDYDPVHWGFRAESAFALPVRPGERSVMSCTSYATDDLFATSQWTKPRSPGNTLPNTFPVSVMSGGASVRLYSPELSTRRNSSSCTGISRRPPSSQPKRSDCARSGGRHARVPRRSGGRRRSGRGPCAGLPERLEGEPSK